MSTEYTINLNTIDKVKRFVNISTSLTCDDIRLSSGRYIVDGKSILGIFSLDLSKDITMSLVGNEEEIKEAVDKLEGFMIK